MIDIEDSCQLLGYLRSTGRIDSRERPDIRKLSGGVSNKTLLLDRPSGESWVIKQALPKLRVRSDWFSDPARIQVEANGLRYLPRVTPTGSITSLLFEDTAENLLAMEAVDEPHENWKQQLLRGEIDQYSFEQFAKLLGSIHRESFVLRDELSPVFASRQFFKTLRLEPYYEHSAQAVPRAASFLEKLVAQTLSRSDTLVHGDFSPKNVLVQNKQLILIDHEVLHFGDPGFDIGFSLTHFLSKALHLPDKREALVQAARDDGQPFAGALRCRRRRDRPRRPRWHSLPARLGSAAEGTGCLVRPDRDEQRCGAVRSGQDLRNGTFIR